MPVTPSELHGIIPASDIPFELWTELQLHLLIRIHLVVWSAGIRIDSSVIRHSCILYWEWLETFKCNRQLKKITFRFFQERNVRNFSEVYMCFNGWKLSELDRGLVMLRNKYNVKNFQWRAVRKKTMARICNN